MKYQVLFSPRNTEKIFKTAVCCSSDWGLRGYKQTAPFIGHSVIIFRLLTLIFLFLNESML